MGVEYERWLIAKGAAFLPAAASIVKLVERLRKEGWIIDPKSPDLAKLRFLGAREQRAQATGGYGVRTVENTFGTDAAAKLAASTDALPAVLSAEWIGHASREELRLVWPVAGESPLPLKYPLSHTPDGPLSYALEIHRSDEYVYPTAEVIGPVPTECRCGEDQAFEWDDEELVPAFGASTGIFAECEACSRTFEPSKGTATLTNPFDGTTSEVYGGAAYRFALKVDCGKCFVADAKLAFAPELVALVENEFGRAFHEVGCLY
jgi:hypothetical protein